MTIFSTISAAGLDAEDVSVQNETLDWFFEPEITTEQDNIPLQEVSTPTLVRNRVTMEWQDLNLVTGSDSRPHLYYLTTGDPDNGRASFRVKLNNTTNKLAKNATIKWRLSSRRSDGTYQTVRLSGQPENQQFFSDRAPYIYSGRDTTRTLLISREILETAYDSDSPKCRLEVEYHWYEGSRPYYNRHVLSFFLFRPAEFLFSSARADGTLSLDQDAHRREGFWMRIRAKEFSASDQQSVQVSSTITTSISRGTSSQQSSSSRMTATAGVDQGQSTTVGAETGASLSVGIEKVVEAGVSSSMSASETQSIQWNRSMAREFAREVVRSQSFTAGYSRSQTINWTIQAAQPGNIRTLYAYPVFDRKRVTVVRFGRANSLGQATRRSQITNFPVLVFSHWVDKSIVSTTSTGSELFGRQSYETSTSQEGVSLMETVSLPKLSAQQVTHLAFEGGGGKGIVYLGAVKAMEELNILRFSNNRLQGISGIAGSSAGAITALALSLGINHAGILRLFKGSQRIQFNRFFELPADPRKQPVLGQGCRNGSRNSVIDQNIFDPIERLLRSAFDSAIPSLVQRNFQGLSPNRLAASVRQKLQRELYQHAVNTSSQDQNRGLEEKLMSPALLYYLMNLVGDLGLFNGCFSRSFFDSLIASRPGGSRNMTFAQHFSRFGVKLVITGSNLERGRTEFFSVDATPHMVVADAIRISMSLPFIYKPVPISSDESRRITGGSNLYAGLWVDGGVWKNLPMRAFGVLNANNHTLGIRLGNNVRVPIRSFTDFLKRYIIDFGIMGSGETDEAFETRLRNRLITLDTGNIGTTDFSPPDTVANPLIEQARQSTRRYFSS